VDKRAQTKDEEKEGDEQKTQSSVDRRMGVSLVRHQGKGSATKSSVQERSYCVNYSRRVRSSRAEEPINGGGLSEGPGGLVRRELCP